MSARRSVGCLALAVVWTACVPSPERMEALAPEAPKEAARSLLASLEAGDVEAIEPTLHADMQTEEAREVLSKLLAAVSGSARFEPRFAHARWFYRSGVRQHEVAYEIALDGRFLVLLMVFRPDDDEQLRLSGIQFGEAETSPIEFHRFTLAGKTPVHYLFVAAAIAIPIFCLVTLVVCWRRRPHRRWLWLLFIALAGPVFRLDWTTGHISLQLLSISVLGSGYAQASLLQPVYVQLGVPIGALVFWVRSPGRATRRETPDPTGTGGPPPPLY